MSEVTPAESTTKVAVTFEVKLGLKNYSNVMARAWVEQNVGEEGEAFSLARAAVFARDAVEGALVDFGGVDNVTASVSATRKERSGEETPISIDEAVALVNGTFGDSAEVTYPIPTTTPSLSTVRVKGKQHGDLPDWLISAAAEAGVSEVYDNRADTEPDPSLDDAANAKRAKRPHFKATTGGQQAKAFWPPKQRRAA